MSRRGNCYDNAAMESWNSTLKSELGERFESPAEANRLSRAAGRADRRGRRDRTIDDRLSLQSAERLWASHQRTFRNHEGQR